MDPRLLRQRTNPSAVWRSGDDRLERMKPTPKDIRSLNLEELEEQLKTWHEPVYRASQILNWLHQKHVSNFSEMKNLPKNLQEKLSKEYMCSALKLKEVPGSFNRESYKYLSETFDGHLLESVLIVQQDRFTVCVSTQLGCKIRCSFCASGKGPFGRNLSAGEIVEQVSLINRHIKGSGHFDPRGQSVLTPKVTNVVFMGMGEPLDNYDATMRSLEILMADWGFGLGGRRITVSTSGITPKIEQFVREMGGRVRLSISLHSSIQNVRSELIPVNKKYQLSELIEALDRLHTQLKREITFEYTLIQGVNDSPEEAKGVAKIANRLNAKVNIIPYNPIREMEYARPTKAQLEFFRKYLSDKGVRVTVRQTSGRDIDAACGQLRLDRIQELKS